MDGRGCAWQILANFRFSRRRTDLELELKAAIAQLQVGSSKSVQVFTENIEKNLPETDTDFKCLITPEMSEELDP